MPDHIVPLAKGGSDDESNIQCLCEHHHQIKTAQDFGYRQRVAVDVDGWPIQGPAEIDPRDGMEIIVQQVSTSGEAP